MKTNLRVVRLVKQSCAFALCEHSELHVPDDGMILSLIMGA